MTDSTCKHCGTESYADEFCGNDCEIDYLRSLADADLQPRESTDTYAFQVVRHGLTRNGTERIAVRVYRAASYPTTTPTGERVQAVEYVPVLSVYGGHDLRDNARNYLRATCRELPTMRGESSQAAQRDTLNGEPVIHHADAFDKFGEPPHAMLAHLAVRADRIGARA